MTLEWDKKKKKRQDQSHLAGQFIFWQSSTWADRLPDSI